MISQAIERDEVIRGGEQSIAAAYSQNFARVADFYCDGWQSLEGIKARAATLLERGEFAEIDRGALVKTLLGVAQSLGAGKATRANIKRLAAPDCFAIVTGQQACIAGGPLFVLAKVAHAVATANALQAAGVNAVPIFWAASEDHDLDEANHYSYLNPKGKLKALRIRDLGKSEHKAVEALTLPASDHPDVAAIRATLGDGPLRAEAEALLELGFGKGFGVGINRMLLKLFGESGLITLEPRHLRRFSGFRRILGMEIERPNLSRDEIEQAHFKLHAAGLEPVLHLREYLNVFALCAGRRRHLYFDGRGLEVVGEDTSYATRGEALQALAEKPENFSSGVALRPLVQGACLPTLAYIGGPGEIAYHASLGGLFERAGVPMPLLLPRWSLVLSRDAAQVAATRATALDAIDASQRASASIAEAALEIRNLLGQSQQRLGKLGTILESDLERLEGRASKALKELRGRTVANPLGRVGVSEAVRRRALEILPNEAPQERMISWLSLWSQWGGVLREHFAARDPFDTQQYAVGG